MTYATQQDMVNRFGDREVIALTDRANVGVINAAVLAQGLTAADDEINAYVAARYSLPFATVPLLVRDFACDIARYRLCGGEVTETEEVRNRYKDAIDFLKRVASNQVTLGLNAASAEVTPSAAVKVSSNNRVFSRNLLADY